MADKTPDGVYADYNPRLHKYHVGVYRRPACLSPTGDFAEPRRYLCGSSSFKRIVRWMLESENRGNGRCYLEDNTWYYESQWAVAQIAMRDG